MSTRDELRILGGDRGDPAGDDAFLSTLLASAVVDEPAEGAKNATLAALGFGTAFAAAAGRTAATGVASSATPGVTNSAVTGVVKLFSAKMVATIASVALVTGAVVGSAATLAIAPSLTDPQPAHAAVASSSGEGLRTPPSAGSGGSLSPPTPSQATSAEPSAWAQRAPETAPSAFGRKVGGPVAADLAGAGLAPPPAVAIPSTLARETVLLSEVREAIQAHDTGTAKARLAAYDAEFPEGVLQTEARVLHSRLQSAP